MCFQIITCMIKWTVIDIFTKLKRTALSELWQSCPSITDLRPSAPQELHVSEMNGESVLLKWDPPENHAVVTNYTILYREANVKDQFKQVQCAPKFLIFSSHKCLSWKIMSD